VTVRSGGQYSVVRAALGLSVAAYTLWCALGRRPELARVGAELHPFALVALGLLALLVAAGRWDRWAGLVLLSLWGWLHASRGEGGEGGVLVVELLLLLNAGLPRAPYGSFDARGRVDPDGGWRAPAWTFAVLLVVLALHAAVSGAVELVHAGFAVRPLVSLSAAPFLLVPRARPWAWGVLFLASVVAWGLTPTPTGFALPLAWLFVFDPAWVAPRRRAKPVRVFYDGTCALCHGFVRFVMAEDRAGVVRFAPLGGPTFERELAPELRANLPDSVVVLDDAGRPLVRSEGVRHVLATLGGWWRVFAVAQALVPRPVRDLVYDAIARVRKSVFGSTRAACPLMPREWTARFDP
jgi:predicted DCC family thiol-disulfide oxidoreductase YuxK